LGAAKKEKKTYMQLVALRVKENFIFAPSNYTVGVAQLVRASDCGSEGRGFETHHPPLIEKPSGQVFLITNSCVFSRKTLLTAFRY
jgi:hypothetical protein